MEKRLKLLAGQFVRDDRARSLSAMEQALRCARASYDMEGDKEQTISRKGAKTQRLAKNNAFVFFAPSATGRKALSLGQAAEARASHPRKRKI